MSHPDDQDPGARPGGGDAPPDDPVAERLPPDEAFELLAHETRFRILETLDEADDALGFADLRDRVGVDDAGQFNYHLGKLVGRFVSRDDEGYSLAAAGWRVVGAVLSGGYTKALDADPVETGAPCVTCGGEMDLEFRGDEVNVRCRECDETYTNTPIPAGIFEGVDPREAPTVVDRWLKRLHSAVEYGFCPNCAGTPERTVFLPDDGDAPDVLDESDDEAMVQYDCERCGFGWYSSFAFVVVLHPAVIGFHYDHGVDVRESPFWEFDWLGADAATVASRDPLRIDVTATVDDETAVFTFDGDLELVDERRE